MIKNKILILLSPSSSGKDYILNKLVSDYNFKPLISHTSRPMRPKEINHITYHFISSEDFMQMIYDNDLIEYRTYKTLVDGISDTWFYGLSKQTIDELEEGANYVTIFDIQGAKEFIEYYGKENCVVCMIKCDDKIREERAKLRGGFSQEEWMRRLEDDLIVFSEENTKGLIDHYITNDSTLEELEIKVKDLVDKLVSM
jgi:guanylate kinase